MADAPKPPLPAVQPWEAEITEADVAEFVARKREEELAEKFGTPAQQLAAGIEGIARGLTGGISTQLEVEAYRKLAEAGDPTASQAIRDIQARAETTAGTAGEVASFLVPIAAGTSAGRKALGKAGSAALDLSAPSLISKAGAATGRAVSESLPAAQGVLGKALQKAITTGAAGGAEGALFGLSHVIHESAFDDPEYTAEAALADVGWGAAMGVGLGAGLGVVEATVPVAVQKAKDALSRGFRRGEEALTSSYKAGEALTGTAGDTAELMLQNRQQIEALSKALPSIADDMAAATPEMADWLLRNGQRLSEMEAVFPGTARQLSRSSPETASHLLDNWQHIITDPAKRIAVAKDMTKGMSDVVGSVDDALKRINQKLAPEEAELLISQKYRGRLEDSTLTKDAYVQTMGRLDDTISKMRSEPELYSTSMARELELVRDGWIRDIEQARSPVEMFNRLRTLRQSVDDIIPYGKDALILDRAAQNGSRVLKELRRDVKAQIVDESLFGKAAARRASLDEAQADYIAANKAFRKEFMRKVEGRGGVRWEMNPAKVNTWINLMADARGQAKSAVWGRYMDAARRVTDEAEAIAQRIPAAGPDAQGLRSLLENTAKRTEEAELSAGVTQMKKQLQGDVIMSSGPVSMGGPEVRQLADIVGRALLPGVVTGAVKSVGKLTRIAKSVPAGLTTLSLLERAGQSIAKVVDSGVRAMLSAAPGVRRVGIGALNAAHVSRETTEARVERVNHLAQNLGETQAVLERQGLEEAPNISAAAQLASVRGVAFLAGKAPKMSGVGPLGKPLPLNGDDAFRFNRYYDAVDRPTSIIARAQNGTLTPLDVEAVSTVYPGLMRKIRESLLGHLMEREGLIPYRQRLMVGMLLGRDVDGTMTPAALQATQAVYQRPDAGPPEDQLQGGGAKVRPSQTGLGKLKQGRRMRTGIEASQENLRGEA